MQNKNLVRRKIKRKSNFEFDLINRHNKQLSSELHDNVSSKLSIIRFKLSHNSEEFVEEIELLDSIIDNVRKISHGFYSPSIEHAGLIDAIRDFLYPLHKTINIEIYNLHKETSQMNKKTELF